ncbi:hypothetical protein, conserved [Leishmania tarentolae]|uniref:Transmembrane protein n=1 Tax=Leishmania tarentolae TaxID=5689 RepID=A0A640KSU9_LEITA|nr:hypothetical protein, conserved [Leishmania tarentolae]
MHTASRVWAGAAAVPAVSRRPVYHALQPSRHSVQRGFSSASLVSSSPLLRSSTSQMMTASVFPCVQHSPNFLAMTLRHQHTTATGETAEASTSAAAFSPGVSSSSSYVIGDKGVRIDPRLLPSTIPGITQEELAARIVQHHSQQSKLAQEMSANELAHDVELMRRSLLPSAFAEYMARLEKEQQALAKEEAKMAAMSPVELHQYRQKKRRQAVRYEWYKTFLLLVTMAGSIAFLFSLFVFFK